MRSEVSREVLEADAPAPGALSLEARLAALEGLAGRIEAQREELARDIAALARRLPGEARGEVGLALRRLRAFPSLTSAFAGREALGTVALVLPSNASLSNPVSTIGSAFLAGNRVRVRFPTASAAWARRLRPLFEESLPGVDFDGRPGREFLEAALSEAEVGAVMIFGDDSWVAPYEPLVRPGRAKLIFEGPGNDPFLVLPGADVERAARDAVRGSFYNAGQACTAPERFYVHRELAPEFTKRIVELAAREVAGDPEDPATTVGPLTNRRVVERIAGQLREARARGAKVLLGGGIEERLLADGTRAWMVEPTVLTEVDSSMALMREETFGPVIPIQSVASDEEALELAERSEYGLAACLYGGGDGHARRLEESHGVVFRDEIWLDYYGRNLHAPYGGRKRSGWVWEWPEGRFERREGPRLNVVEFSRPAGGGE